MILIPIAMGLFYSINEFKLDPMFAAVAMAMSSISVAASSLVLKLYEPESEMKTLSKEPKTNYSHKDEISTSKVSVMTTEDGAIN